MRDIFIRRPNKRVNIQSQDLFQISYSLTLTQLKEDLSDYEPMSAYCLRLNIKVLAFLSLAHVLGVIWTLDTLARYLLWKTSL